MSSNIAHQTSYMKNIPIASPSTGMEEWNACKEPLLSGWLTSGPKVREFERLFAERHNVTHAVAVTSCTTALHLALAALKIGPGDEVIVPAFTWVATANAVMYCGAKPVFADIDINTFNIDPAQIAEKVNERTKAIIPVHLFGLCADMDAIKEIAGSIPLIEDAACAAGAAFNDKPAGSMGAMGCFSFHPRKSITTGEGGMITTNDETFGRKMEVLRNHGASVSEEVRHHGPKPYLLADFHELGYNYRMTDLQGAVGIVQLSKLDAFIDKRNEWATYYESQLKDIDWMETPLCPAGYRHGWQSYVCMIDEDRAPYSRNEIMEKLLAKGISTRPGTHAVHMLDFYKNKFGLKPDDFPNAKEANDKSMAIPLHNQMDEEDFEYVRSIMYDV